MKVLKKQQIKLKCFFSYKMSHVLKKQFASSHFIIKKYYIYQIIFFTSYDSPIYSKTQNKMSIMEY